MKIYLDTVGCRLNQSEIEIFARQFLAGGHTLVASPQTADLAVINTCTVTASAASDSRQKIRQATRSGSRQVIVTGCWATMQPHKTAAMPGVSQVVPNIAKDTLVERSLAGRSESSLLVVPRQPVPGARMRTRAFIKTQDGCDNHCTFCITTLARGAGRSQPIVAVLADVNAALAGGAQEVVLTGVHLGSWGQDFTPPATLRCLVETILSQTPVPRLRLSSLEPWDLDEYFFQLWSDPRLCPHLHLPLQSGCEQTLRRMGRRTTPQAYARLLEVAQKAIPDVAITTDIMVGFPGESEQEYVESLAFVQHMGFAGGHVFTYSARPETRAASMPEQVPHPLRNQRNAAMRLVFAEAASRYRRRFLGRTLQVLWEQAEPLSTCANDGDGWMLGGLTSNYLRVTASSAVARWNQIDPVCLRELTEAGLCGEICN
jgi:threonylcarbamoyladenosine tRNA methylthiotransferase MtaB